MVELDILRLFYTLILVSCNCSVNSEVERGRLDRDHCMHA